MPDFEELQLISSPQTPKLHCNVNTNNDCS